MNAARKNNGRPSFQVFERHRKPLNVTLSPEALSALSTLATIAGVSRSVLLERLIMAAWESRENK